MDEESGLVKTCHLVLDWPPTVNTYWRHSGHIHYISQKGVQYKEMVKRIGSKYEGYFTESERLSMQIEAYPPDKRKRDLDNILKSLLDSLESAKIYVDDNQIDKLSIHRNTFFHGIVEVSISLYQGTSSSIED